MNDEPPPWMGKVDHRLRATVTRLAEPDQAGRSARVLIRFTGSTERLIELGAQVHSRAGDIASCTIALADLARIAGAPEIQFVELALPLAPGQA